MNFTTEHKKTPWNAFCATSSPERPSQKLPLRSMTVPRWRCSSCGHRRALEVEIHNHLQVTLLVAGRVVSDVQAAIDRVQVPTETPPDYRWLCENCGNTDTPTCTTPSRRRRYFAFNSNAGETSRPSCPDIRSSHTKRRRPFRRLTPTNSVGSIMHSGPTPNAGHYVSCARHGSPAPAWWFYNDTLRRQASENERTSSLEFKSYVLVYDRLGH